jgi:hypothetical protein
MADPESAASTPAEVAALASRLRTGAGSAVLRDEPEMQRDVVAAATILDQLVQLHADIHATAAVVDGLTQMLDFVVGR